jgi:hypothetical protein
VTPKQRSDLLIQAGATIAAILAAAPISRFFEPRWELMVVLVAVFVATTLVKLRWPAHWILGGAGWAYYLMSWLIAAGVVLVLTDYGLLGYWSIPAAVCFGLLYCVIHVIYVDRGNRKR